MIDAVFAAIKIKLDLVRSSNRLAIADKHADCCSSEAVIRELEVQVKKLKLALTAILERYLDGKLSKESFQTQKAQGLAVIQESAERLYELKSKTDDYSEIAESHRPYLNQDSLSREMVRGLITSVRIMSPEEIEIVWNFQDCYNDLEQRFRET